MVVSLRTTISSLDFRPIYYAKIQELVAKEVVPDIRKGRTDGALFEAFKPEKSAFELTTVNKLQVYKDGCAGILRDLSSTSSI